MPVGRRGAFQACLEPDIAALTTPAVWLWPVGFVVGLAGSWIAYHWREPRLWIPDLITGWVLMSCGLVGWSAGRADRPTRSDPAATQAVSEGDQLKMNAQDVGEMMEVIGVAGDDHGRASDCSKHHGSIHDVCGSCRGQ